MCICQYVQRRHDTSVYATIISQHALSQWKNRHFVYVNYDWLIGVFTLKCLYFRILLELLHRVITDVLEARTLSHLDDKPCFIRMSS